MKPTSHGHFELSGITVLRHFISQMVLIQSSTIFFCEKPIVTFTEFSGNIHTLSDVRVVCWETGPWSYYSAVFADITLFKLHSLGGRPLAGWQKHPQEAFLTHNKVIWLSHKKEPKMHMQLFALQTEVATLWKHCFNWNKPTLKLWYSILSIWQIFQEGSKHCIYS